MPPTVQLYVVPPDSESLRALERFRALVDGPWRGRCGWRVVDPLASPGSVAAPLPRLPALARVDPGGVSWLPTSPAAEIPVGWLDQPSSPAATVVAAPPLPVTLQVARQLLDSAPAPSALFLEPDCLAYANPAFLARYGLDAAQALGHRVGEWETPAPVNDLAGALGGSADPASPLVVAPVRIPDAAVELALIQVVVSIPSVEGMRELLEEIRRINHAMGNSLVGILGYAELLQRDLPPADSPAQARARAIGTAAQRVDALSQEISLHARRFLKQLPER